MISWMLDFIQNVYYYVLNFLPASPFNGVANAIHQWSYLKWVNWFIPVGNILGAFSLWLTAVAGYYIYSAMLRWIKVV